MKTTLDINDTLLNQAQNLAARQHSNLHEILESALRAYLQKHDKPGFSLRRASFKGEGLQTNSQHGDWESIRQRAYENHGA